ncbi:MAG: DUF1598 domain-containing protein [Pirellulales bacterium]|nr:DUF1598 domain-containing protein [Pirellulales bacterium]
MDRSVLVRRRGIRVAWAAALAVLISPDALAQNGPGARQPAVNAAVGPGVVGPAGGPFGPGGQGGGANADFDSLIDLITSTVAHDSWLENGTGEGEIQPFAINGVYVDAAGAVRLRPNRAASQLAGVRSAGRGGGPLEGGDARQSSRLRYVSLSKLEAAIVERQRLKQPLEPAMLTLAGLQRIEYVLAYPETGDLVLAGPAGDWGAAPGGGLISLQTGRPVVRLDDLLALWRRHQQEKQAAFGCSIVPRQEALANVQQYLTSTSVAPLAPDQRRAWLDGLRDSLGVQDVEYYNVDSASRIAALLFYADYHMKLIGMGLAEGTAGVESYLATVKLGADGRPPAMSVLRWWFALPPADIETTPDRDAYLIPAQCVEVLSENEMLAARGQRVHTGSSEDLNRRFAESFTANFASLAGKYPVYGELERAFELALVVALMEREGLAEKVGWSPSVFLDGDALRLPQERAPRSVETVINHRVIGGRHIIAGVSGGVWVDGGKKLSVTNAAGAGAAQLGAVRREPSAKPTAGGGKGAWWWD